MQPFLCRRTSITSPTVFIVAGLSLLFIALTQNTTAQRVTISYADPDGNVALRHGEIPRDFLGISLESSSVVDDGKGPWLSGKPSAFPTLMRTIGVRSIRIGGNSAERKGYPTIKDAAAVNDFVHAIHGSLLWVLPAKDNEYSLDHPAQYADFAKAMAADRRRKGYTFPSTFLISNEPDLDMKARGDNADSAVVSYETYEQRFRKYGELLNSKAGGPTVSGPSFAKDATYAVRLAQSSMPMGIGFITGHTYPLGAAGSHGANNSDDAIAVLLRDNHKTYQAYYDKWAAPAAALGFKTRIDETNSMYFNGAQQDLLHEYAASLWVLDYLCYDATHTDLGGMNLHNGPIGSNGYNTFSPIGRSVSYTLSAVGYGLFAFSRGSQGTPLNATIGGSPDQAVLSAYGVRAKDASTYLYILNKTMKPQGVTASIDAKDYRHADVMYLQQAHSDPRAASGITLGGQPVKPNGTWSGGYTEKNLRPIEGKFEVGIPGLSAAIIHLTR